MKLSTLWNLLMLAAKISLVAAGLLAPGCSMPVSVPLASVTPGIGFAGKVACVDADLQAARNFQPKLPDDLGKPGEYVPPPPADAPEKIPEIVVYVYSPSWCSGCKTIKQEIQKSRTVMTPDDAPPLMITFKFVEDFSVIPDWAKSYVADGRTWPVFHWNSTSDGPRMFSGWKGLKHFIGIVRQHERPKAKGKVA